MLSNSHTRRRLDELFTVLRLFFAIAVGYTFNCERWSVAGTRRTEVGKGNAQTPALLQLVKHAYTLFSVPAQAVNSGRKYIVRSAFLTTGPLNSYYRPVDEGR